MLLLSNHAIATGYSSTCKLKVHVEYGLGNSGFGV